MRGHASTIAVLRAVRLALKCQGGVTCLCFGVHYIRSRNTSRTGSEHDGQLTRYERWTTDPSPTVLMTSGDDCELYRYSQSEGHTRSSPRAEQERAEAQAARERLTSLEDRLARLLAIIPSTSSVRACR